MLIRLLTLLLFVSNAQAQISVNLSRGEGPVGSTFEVNIIAEQRQPAGTPDFSVFEQDFNVVHNSKVAVSNFKNNHTVYKTQWKLRLVPIRTGVLTIPSLLIGSERSRSSTYLAKEGSELPSTPDIFIQAKVIPELGYSHSAYNLSVKLFYRTPLGQAELTEPTGDNLRVERLGAQLSYGEVYDGQDYQVVEQRYAVFPLTDGRFELPEIEFTGSDPEQLESYKARSKPILFDTLSPPETQKPWLAATEIRITSQWSTPVDQLQVGDTPILTLIVEGHNIPADWLPALSFSAPAGISLYPQSISTSQNSHNGILVSRKKIPFKLLLTQAGILEIPSIELFWWDTVRDQAEKSVLAGTLLDVQPFSTPISLSETPTQLSMPTKAVLESTASDDQLQGSSPSITGSSWQAWVWATLAFICAAGWTLTRAKYQQLATQQNNLELQAAKLATVSSQDNYLLDETNAYNQLARACSINDPTLASEQLVRWAKFCWPQQPIGNIGDVERWAGDQTLTYLLRDLEQHLHEPDDKEPWQGDLILAQVDRIRKRINHLR